MSVSVPFSEVILLSSRFSVQGFGFVTSSRSLRRPISLAVQAFRQLAFPLCFRVQGLGFMPHQLPAAGANILIVFYLILNRAKNATTFGTSGCALSGHVLFGSDLCLAAISTCGDVFFTPTNFTRAAQVSDFASLAVLVGELLCFECRLHKHVRINSSVSERMMLVMLLQ